MAIVYNENKRTFSLHTAKTTYQLKIGNLRQDTVKDRCQVDIPA